LSQMIGRAIGVVVLCLLVGLLLTHLGIAARGILDDTWHTILSVGRLVGNLVEWAVPYTLLAAVVAAGADRVRSEARRPEIKAPPARQLGLTQGAAAPDSILVAAAAFPSPAAPFLVGLTPAPSISTLISSSEVSPDLPRLTRIMSLRIST